VIVGNHLTKNIKANIALGGLESENTKIKFNRVERSKQEGIFVVEGGDGLEIDSNMIINNKDGIVLLHSKGAITNNRIEDNDNSGLTLLSETQATIETNKIENNNYGIDIKDPSDPILRKNTVRGNSF
jgi:F-box protein 11